MRLAFLLLLSMWLGTMPGLAQDNTPKYSNEFLALGVGARSFGMGMSSVAIVDDVTAGYWNPAGLRSIDVPYQLSLMHASYFAGIANYDYGAFSAQIDDKSSASLSLIRFAVDDIPDTRFLFDANGALNYDNIRFFSAADYAAFLSYARTIDLLDGTDIGGSIKIIHRTVGDFATAWGFGVDLGIQKVWKDWRFGISYRDAFGTFNSWSHNTEEVDDIYLNTGNILPENTTEITLPRLILGAARKVQAFDFLSVLATIETDLTFDGKRNTVVSTDFVSIDPHGGIEFGYKNIAFLRAGMGQFQQVEEINGGTDWKFTPNFGIGFNIREVMIDYALTDIGDQAEGLYSHVFSVRVDFNRNEK